MGKLTVRWERSIYDEQPHQFIRELATFRPPFLHEYDCAAMLGMWAKMRDLDRQLRQRFEQFCRNGAAVEWLGEEIATATNQALAKWENGDFTKEASNNGQE